MASAMTEAQYKPVSNTEDGVTDEASSSDPLPLHDNGTSALETSTNNHPNSHAHAIESQHGGRRVSQVTFSDTLGSTSESMPQATSSASLLTYQERDDDDSPAESGEEIELTETVEDRPPSLHHATSTRTNNSRTSLLSWKSKDRLSNYFTPEKHSFLEKPTQTDTARPYVWRMQATRLWRLAAGEWLVTALICGLYALVLVLYEKKNGIDTPARLRFNALVTILNFCLGINLAASMRSYAKLMRWLFLAMRYRPLETFDLVLGCENISNVIILLFKATREKTDKLYPFPSRTQIISATWLLGNITLTLLVGMLGLSYNLNVAEDFVFLKNGNLSIVDLPSLQSSDLDASRHAVGSWGERGFTIKSINSLSSDSADAGFYQTAWNGTSQYFFVDSAAKTKLSATSQRKIQSNATCSAYDVLQGQMGDQPWFVYRWNNGTVQNETFPESVLPGAGGLLAWSKVNATCGNRCTSVRAFVTQKNSNDNTAGSSRTNFGKAQYFYCRNNISQILSDDGRSPIVPAPPAYQIDDDVARMIAGTIGWSGRDAVNSASSNSFNFVAYDNTSEVALGLSRLYNQSDSVPSAKNMADFISSSAIKGVVAMDDTYFGLPRKYVQGATPTPVQILNVDWRGAGLLLGGITFGQLVGLVLVFALANRAIIKDDSYLSMAKLYWSLLANNGFGDKGCMLRRSEIVKNMKNPRTKVIYGYTETEMKTPNGLMVNHLDVFEQGVEERDVFNKFRRDVYYDGGTGAGRGSHNDSSLRRRKNGGREHLDDRDVSDRQSRLSRRMSF